MIGFDSTMLQKKTQVRVAFYNVRGQQVRCLDDRLMDAGKYETTWDFSDERERKLPPGTYFYRVVLGDEIFTGKVLRIN